jgi:hypothetical protein
MYGCQSISDGTPVALSIRILEFVSESTTKGAIMFGFNRKTENDEILSLELHTRASGSKQTTIRRNRNPRRRKRAGVNIYHRADQFLLRFRVAEASN